MWAGAGRLRRDCGWAAVPGCHAVKEPWPFFSRFGRIAAERETERELRDARIATALLTVEMILQKFELLSFVIGLEKFVWLKMLNKSARN